MKSFNQRKNKKIFPTIPVVIAAAIVAISVAIWLVYFLPKQNNYPVTSIPVATSSDNITYSPPTEEEKKVSEAQKDKIIQGSNNPADPALNVTLSRSFQDASGYNLRTIVDGSTHGECVATLTKAGQPTIVKSFPVIFEATSSFCQNATIAVGDFSVGGTWNLSLTVQSDGKQSAPATQNVEITK